MKLDVDEDITGGDYPAEFVTSFARGLQVIRAFGLESERLTLTEVAERAGLTRAGARRLLITLLHLGYAGQSGRHYFLTPKVLTLGFAYTTSMPLFPFATQILEELVQELQESTSLAVLDDTDIVFVFSYPFRPSYTVAFTTGSRFPAHATSAGRLLLGQLHDSDLDDYFKRAKLAKLAPKTITDATTLKKIIREDAAKNWSFVDGEVVDQIGGIAVPISNVNGQAVAAINLSFASASTTKRTIIDRFLPALQKAALKMSFSLNLKDRINR